MRLRRLVPLALAACFLLPCAALADDHVVANGRILSSDGKTPVEGAIIAVYDEKANVIAHATTDADGRYSLSVPRDVLHLSPKRKGGNFLGSILGGVSKLTSIAASVAPMAIGAGALGGLALPGGAGGIGQIIGGGGIPNLGEIGQGIGQFAAVGMGGVGQMKPTAAQIEMVKKMMPPGMNTEYLDSMMNMYGANSQEPTANSPGALVLRVVRTGSSEVGGIAQVYWLQNSEVEENGKSVKRSEVWLDPIWLSKDGGKAPSRIVRGYFAISDAHADPPIVEFGQTLTLSVELPLPEEPRVNVVVLAHNAKTGETFELAPAGDGLYRAAVPVDKKFAQNDQVISILAYPREAGASGRSDKEEDAISGAGLWKLDKPFVYNPRLIASRNRLDLKVTVVEPARGR